VSSTAVPAPYRRPSSPPGAKRARHKRWTRIATAVTVVGLGAFVGALALLLGGGDETDPRRVACRTDMEGIAREVGAFADRKGRLPSELKELFGPESTSPFDAEPWDCWHRPYEYRVIDPAARRFLLRSRGPDGLPDTPDDVVWPDGASWR
jgi:hypothetical protein